MARTYNLIGLNNMYLGAYSVSMDAFQEGMNLLERSRHKKTQFFAEIKGNLALLYEKLSDFEKALKFQKKALSIHQKNNYSLGISNTYSNIGQLYSHLGKYDKALAIFDKAMKIKQKIGNPYHIANGLTNIGITNFELKQYTKALKYLNKAKSIYIGIEHLTNLSTVFKSIGDVQLALNHFETAKINYDSALKYAKKSKNKRAVLAAIEGLADTAFKISDFKRAYNFQREAITLKDSLLSDEKRDELAKLEAKYQYDKEKQTLTANFNRNLSINEANTNQQILIRNASIAVGVVGMLALAIGFTLFRKKREAELDSRIIASELQTLRAQLNPHFIFNSLNSINDFVQKNQKDAASEYLVRFSRMMRKILDNSTQEEVPLSEEIEFLENYLRLEQERLNHKFTFKIDVDSSIDADETFIPPTLLQPYIENSIWHGLSPKKKNGLLHIHITGEKDMLTCIIDDNGVGLRGVKSGGVKIHNSFGSNSTANRLNLLNRRENSTKSKVEFVEKEEGVQVKIQLPLSVDAHI